MDDPMSLIDGVRMVAQLEDPARNPEIKQAYGQVFGGEAGRLVLADILRRSGFAQQRPADTNDGVRRHLDGQIFLALAIAGDAGFGAASLAVAVMTNQLEGATHDRSSNNGASGRGTDIRLDDDPDF